MSTRSEKVICNECLTEFAIKDIWASVGGAVNCPLCGTEWKVYVDEDGESYWFGLEAVG